MLGIGSYTSMAIRRGGYSKPKAQTTCRTVLVIVFSSLKTRDGLTFKRASFTPLPFVLFFQITS